MNDALWVAQRRAWQAAQEQLYSRAEQLYRHGFTPTRISKTQMNALLRLARADDELDHAKANMSRYLRNQLAKPERNAERRDSESSWSRKSLTKPAEKLGDILLDWLSNNTWMASDQIDAQHVEPLAALRACLGYFHGRYRYEDVMGEAMPAFSESAMADPTEDGQPQ